MTVEREWFLYCARESSAELVKVGISRDVARRSIDLRSSDSLQELQRAIGIAPYAPARMRVLRTWPLGTSQRIARICERLVLDALHASHMGRGEWFAIPETTDLVALIEDAITVPA